MMMMTSGGARSHSQAGVAFGLRCSGCIWAVQTTSDSLNPNDAAARRRLLVYASLVFGRTSAALLGDPKGKEVEKTHGRVRTFLPPHRFVFCRGGGFLPVAVGELLTFLLLLDDPSDVILDLVEKTLLLPGSQREPTGAFIKKQIFLQMLQSVFEGLLGLS
ncbi:hypothetical protein EYF80_009174 [Liparis tanakae]|uniref:Uncharacterized protein n=1 Tax=Liparis tanakae TaxID=230148 RepID=A0A4Z2IS52_9TELE|nr:hypothetical protein EYF80_009174 [Liparis tanakae]